MAGLDLSGGFIPNLPFNASRAQMIDVLNELIDAHNDGMKTQILSDGVTKRVLIGYQKAGFTGGEDIGVKVSKVDKDVRTATGTDIIFTT